jgi:primosomal protein N' (replication factor Y)
MIYENQSTNNTNCFANILFPLALEQTFTYLALPNQQIGDVVLVEFGSRKIWGVVWNISFQSNYDNNKIKPVLEISCKLKLTRHHLAFIQQLADYNLANLGLVLKSFLANFSQIAKAKNPIKNISNNILPEKFVLKTLNEQQEKILNDIKNKFDSNKTFLLHGATGSGKTEIFFHLIADKLKQNCHQQILILLPEIALTSQLVIRFQQQFGFDPVVWHSKITASEKKAIFLAITKGTAKVIIGARSALLLPFLQLGLVIVDEEHDGSFKQEDIFNFHARDMAILYSKIANFTVLLCSATPSLESFHNATSGKYQYLHLTQNFGSGNEINFIDLSQEKTAKKNIITPILQREIAKNMTEKQQTLLFLNKRGYAPVTICKECKHKYSCTNCSFHLVFYKKQNKLLCHHCGYTQKLPQKIATHCLVCKAENSLISLGFAIEKLIEETQALFPQARLAVASSDTLKSFTDANNLVQKITNQEVDIIIGTQIIAKGYDFGNLSLIGIVDADSLLYSSNLRATEQGFQLFTQLIGRSGRRKQVGKVFIQTYNPKNLLFQYLNKVDSFYAFELKNRKIFNLPPFTQMAKLEISAKKAEEALDFAKHLVQHMPIDQKLVVYGPAPAPIAKLKNRHHFLLNINVNKKINLAKLLKDVLAQVKIPSFIRVRVYINPS